MYNAALMDDVIFRPSMCMRTGSFGYRGRLYGPVCEQVSKHSCASLSAITLSCSGIVSEWNALSESQCPATCRYCIYGARDIRFNRNDTRTSACDCFSDRVVRGFLPWWMTPMLSQ